MSKKSKQELRAHYSKRYMTADAKDKPKLLDEFVTITGYHRKYAIALLNHRHWERRSPRRRPRGKKYGTDVQAALVKLWMAANRICTKRLVPFIPELMQAMVRHGELEVSPGVAAKLQTISPATADRLLKVARNHRPWLSNGTTRPGTLLKRQIPVRTFADWQETRAGFAEVDLVAHCGQTTDGEYLNSLVLTDIATGWTEPVAVLNRSLATVTAAIRLAQKHLPFDLLGLDSDNGSEFINHHLLKYCQEHSITFTRCRPNKKNDQCFVEQKNYTVVRQVVGYDRLEGHEACRALAALYRPLRLYVNFFQPSLKLVNKRRDGSRVTKTYEQAKTPCHRVLDAADVPENVKRRLREDYESLNPVALLEQIQFFQDRLWDHAKVRFTSDAMPAPK